MAQNVVVKNATRLAVIETRLDTLIDALHSLDEKLFGNGQPGEIAGIKRRVYRLETWMWRAMGAIGLAVLIVEVVAWTLHKIH